MLKIKKGSFQYLKKQPIRQGLITVFLFLMAAGVMYIGYAIFRDFKNLLTVVSMLGMLPACRSLVNMIMFFKAEKNTCPTEIFLEIEKVIGDKELIHGYDLYLTSEKKNFPINALFVDDNNLYLFSLSEKIDKEACKEHIKLYMSKNGIKDISIKLMDTSDKYIERVSKVVSGEIRSNDTANQIYNVMLNLSL